jgi:CheY-like chemotaxis protein
MAQILLVEDNPAMLETLSFAMRAKGHSVVSASNGAEGIERFAAASFDVVVTDIIMPDLDGIGMIDEMRRMAPKVKIIAISGGGTAVEYDFLDAARKHGAMATLEKPFPISEFHSLLERCSQA